MKITYYNYYFTLRNDPAGIRYQFNLSSVLKRFCQFNDVELKNSFESKDGERMYLLNPSGSTFMFLITRDQDIIKSINSNDLNCDDIHEKLEQDESVGFASYVYFRYPYYAIGTTLKGPKNNSFASFVNQLLKKLGVRSHEFYTDCMMGATSKEEILRMPFIGRTRFEVDPSNSIGRELSSFFGFGNSNEIDSFEVIIKPKRRQQIQNTSFINNISDEGIRKFVVKAKEGLDDALTDFYLVQAGALADVVESGSEQSIMNNIRTRANENPAVALKLEELSNDELYEETDISSLGRFVNLDSWNDHFEVD